MKPAVGASARQAQPSGDFLLRAGRRARTPRGTRGRRRGSGSSRGARPAPCGCAGAAGRPRRSRPMVASGPLVIITTRSESRIASSTSWVTQIAVTRVWLQTSISTSCSSQRVRLSSIPNGSSSSSSFGREREGAGDADALAHAVRHVGGEAVHRVGEADLLEVVFDDLLALGARRLADRPGRRRSRRSRARSARASGSATGTPRRARGRRPGRGGRRGRWRRRRCR